MKTMINSFLKLSVLLSFIFMASCTAIDPIEDVDVPETLDYVGSQKCADCHRDHYDRFIESGHPHQMTKNTGSGPGYPIFGSFLTPKLPIVNGVQLTWNDVSYTLGGFGWKMRFLDNNGYFYTGAGMGNLTQWNNVNNTQSVYQSANALGTYGFGSCGSCHTTGFKSVADGATPKDNLVGIQGDFKYGGTQCEACHGMGNKHVVTKSKLDIQKIVGTNSCKPCHWRRNAATPETNMLQQTSGGWEMHREQTEQIATNKHSLLANGCNSCHDPHSSVKHDAVAKGTGIKVSCSACHSGPKYATNMHHDATCLDCHMPKTANNGTFINKYLGDGRNHNFKINLDATAKYLTTIASGTHAGTWANYDKKGSTLGFACYSCHKDSDGIGGTKSWRTLTELSVKGSTFHK